MDKNENNLRQFSLTSFAVDNGTSVFLIALMILIFGIQGYENMPNDLWKKWWFPEGGKALLSDIGNHPSNVTSQMKSV